METAFSASKRLCWGVIILMSTRASALDIDDLRRDIDARGPATVEAMIDGLPLEYRRNYTLAYDSQSLQGASHDNPRAILYGRTAQLVLTFNGDPSQQHYNVIEAMQFREERNVFELYSIDFEGGAPRISGPNPEVCAGCHGNPPHPIWSSYEYGERETSHWPGFYGSTHDAPVQLPEEKAAFERFRKRAAEHPRYRHLVREEPGSPWFPYGPGPVRHELRPNNRLGNLLSRWYARQIVAVINESGFVNRHPGVAQAWLLQCPGTDEEAYQARVRVLFDERFQADEHALAHALLDRLPAERRVPFMMERLLGDSDSYSWDMSIEAPEDHGRFFTGIVTIDELVGARWMSMLDDRHWLKPYFQPWSSRELYDTFSQGYYDSNVRPGGVGRAYDSVAGFYNESRAQQACPGIMRTALAGLPTQTGADSASR